MHTRFRNGTLPEVWIPPSELRDQRELLRLRIFLVHLRTRVKNRIHGTLARHNVQIPFNLCRASPPTFTPGDLVRPYGNLALLNSRRTKYSAISRADPATACASHVWCWMVIEDSSLF